MRRKRTGGKSSAYRREKAIMTASVVLVLAAMTVTGISVYRNHQKSQEEEQHIVDFSKLEKGDPKSGVPGTEPFCAECDRQR